MAVLDTSFLYAFYYPDDAHHQRAHEAIRHLKPGFVFTTFLAFQELMTLITYKKGPQEAVQVGQIFLDPKSPFQLLKVDDEYLDSIWEEFANAPKSRLSFADLAISVISRNLKMPLLSFDQEQMDYDLQARAHSTN